MVVQDLKKYIYENEKIEYVLEKLGCGNIKYHENHEYYSASFPDGDNLQGINIKNNKYLSYRSFSRSVSYEDFKDLIDLVIYITKKTFTGSIKYLHKILKLKYTVNNIKRNISDKKNILTTWDVKYFERFKSSNYFNVADIKFIPENILHDYVPLLYIGWYKEGIAPWTRDKFGIEYSYSRSRIIIPLRYWKSGELLGINSRTTIENFEEFGIKKYWITPSYPKNMNLYGLWENMKSIIQTGYCVVVEAEKSVLKRDTLLDDTLVSVQGHSISEEQKRILIGLNVEIIIAFDKDVNINEIRFICEKFYNIRKVSYMYDKWDILGEKDSPVDVGNNGYKFLLNNRIKYNSDEHKKYLESLKNK